MIVEKLVIRGILEDKIINCLDFSNRPITTISLNRYCEIKDGTFITPNILFHFTYSFYQRSLVGENNMISYEMCSIIEPLLIFERIK